MKKQQRIAVNQAHAVAAAKLPVVFNPPQPWVDDQKALFDGMIITRERRFWNPHRLMIAWRMTDVWIQQRKFAKWVRENEHLLGSQEYHRVQSHYEKTITSQNVLSRLLGMTAQGQDSASRTTGMHDRQFESNVQHIENEDGEGWL
jgi:hypothetical protein